MAKKCPSFNLRKQSYEFALAMSVRLGENDFSLSECR